MANFAYRALSKTGELVTGQLDAPDHGEVLRRIEFLGLVPIDAQQESNAPASISRLLQTEITKDQVFSSGPGPQDILAFYRDLAMLLGSGVRIDEALDILCDPDMSLKLRPTIETMRNDIKSGKSFAEAMARHGQLFAPMHIALVRIGEASGGLSHVMSALAQDVERNVQLRQTVIDALRYPAFVLGAALLVFGFFLFFVLPQFEPVLQDLGSRTDPVLAGFMRVSATVRGHQTELLIGSGVVVAAVLYLLRNHEARTRVLNGIAQSTLFRGMARDFRTSVFCRGLGVLLGNGVRLTAALELLSEALATGARRTVWDTTRAQVRQGASLAEALVHNPDVAPLAVRMLRIGEQTGKLSDMSQRCAMIFELRFERQLKRWIAAVGPVSILFISTLVGGLAVSLMTSLVSIGQLAN